MNALRLAAVLALVAAAVAIAPPAARPLTTVHIGAGIIQSTLPDLLQQTKAIAIVEVVSDPSEHWNAKDNRSWGTLGDDSFIYRDVPVRVVRLEGGSLPSSLTLRDPGGTADGYEFEVDGTATWNVGSQYLVFVTRSTFPTREGAEDNWTPVRLGQGVFSWSGKDWYEPIQNLRVSGDEIQDVVALLPSR